jgi:hypothetical protein
VSRIRRALAARHTRQVRAVSRRLLLAVALLAAACGTDTIQLRPDAALSGGEPDAARDACVCLVPCTDDRPCVEVGLDACDTAVGICREPTQPTACASAADCADGRSCLLEADPSATCPGG